MNRLKRNVAASAALVVAVIALISAIGGVSAAAPARNAHGARTLVRFSPRALTAVVFSDGTLLHGNGVSMITHTPDSGLYDVYFKNPNAGACTQVASIADMTPGTISAYGGQVANNVVQVQTADTSGNSADRTFQLIVSC